MKQYSTSLKINLPPGKYHLKKDLIKAGLYEDTSGIFIGKISTRKAVKIQKICDREYVRIDYTDTRWFRNDKYRKEFFAHNKPIIKDSYFCAYCGKILTRKNITVDHLYPIDKARSDIKLQKKLLKRGITNINNADNLVPACMDCNKKKGTSIDGWIFRGQLGRHKIYWIIRKVINTIIITLIGCTCFYLYSILH